MYCPNCWKELIPYQVQDKIEHYCKDTIDCGYATVYTDELHRARKEYIEGKYDNNSVFKFVGQEQQIQQNKSKLNDHKLNNNDIKSVNTEQIREIKKPEKYEIKLDNIVGYEPIKEMLRKIVNHKGRKKIHGLIVGAAGTSKTVFLKSLESELVPQGCDFHYIDAATLTKRGLLDYLFEHDNLEIVCIDEVDKIPKEYQAVLLNLLETGVLQTTSYNNIRKKEVKGMIVICTGNYLEKIIEPVRTRFMTMYLKAYTRDEYLHVCSLMLTIKYKYISSELASYIANQLYNNIKPINMRDADRVGNMIRDNPTKESVNIVIQTLKDYAIPKDILEKLDKQT